MVAVRWVEVLARFLRMAVADLAEHVRRWRDRRR